MNTILKMAKKTGWTEQSVNSDDRGYGTVTWLNDKKLEERSYSSDSNLLYLSITQLNDSYEELTADFTYYEGSSHKFHMFYENLYKDGHRYALIVRNLLPGGTDTPNTTDTIFFEESKEDQHGNFLHSHLRYSSGAEGRYTIRSIEYY